MINTKPLYRVLEQESGFNMEKHKEHMKSLKDLRQPMDHDKIKEHMKKFE